jgi:hypothetical protein
MLEFLRGKGSDRKLRLFAVACCRQLLREVRVNPWDEHAVEVAERYADGSASVSELQEAANGTTPDWTAAFACQEAASVEGGVDAADYAADNAAWEAGAHAASLVDDDTDSPSFAAGREAERAAQAQLIRCIFGNPFRPVTLDPAWRTPQVIALAQTAYNEHRFGDLPVMADALEEAGCSNTDVISHCRGFGPHVRGCWALDLVLDKR